jgi:nucleoside-diphosphate-sugar epimerase
VDDAATANAGGFCHRDRKAALGAGLCHSRRHMLGDENRMERQRGGRGGNRQEDRTHLGSGRPTEVETLLGDPTKAKQKLGWAAEVTFDQLVTEMVAADLDAAKRDAMISKEGYKIYNHNE